MFANCYKRYKSATKYRGDMCSGGCLEPFPMVTLPDLLSGCSNIHLLRQLRWGTHEELMGPNLARTHAGCLYDDPQK